MSAINDLIEQIPNAELRSRIQQEINKMNKQKKFGLVFEEHLPENVLLYDVPVRRGKRVSLRNAAGELKNKTWIVSKIESDVALCWDPADGSEKEFSVKDLVVVAEFGEAIYPYLKPIDAICNAPDSDLWHTLIEADNYHALQLLEYLYAGKVDCIFIDPPYNSGARDWKYNNDYVDSSDAYRHSKWLSFMQRRLTLAKKLLNPQKSALIITIDEKEYLHLGCLLEQLFPEATIQMVTSVISGKGVSRTGMFSRVEEYIFYVTLGDMTISQLEKNMLTEPVEDNSKNAVDFLGFRRRNKGNFRTSRPNQFYPVIVDNEDGHIVAIGDVVAAGVDRNTIPIPEGCTGLWPLDPSGSEKIWSLVPESARLLLDKGYLKCINWDKERKKGSVKYLAEGTVRKIDEGKIIIDERDSYGAVISGHLLDDGENSLRPRRVWNQNTHNASSFGTLLLKKYLVTKRFDFPKSLYAVHDTLRFVIGDNPNALVLDFFAGSGTTLHAINLLNKEDNGQRRCIMVTNNELSEEEADALTANGYGPGDPEWENMGIARHVTWPRTITSILGVNVNNQTINDSYITYKNITTQKRRQIKHLSFIEDVEHITLQQKKDLISIISHGRIAASSVTDDCSFYCDDADQVAILLGANDAEEFIDLLKEKPTIERIFIVSPNRRFFNAIKRKLLADLAELQVSVPLQIPMSEGFKSNAIYFKLGFLDKNEVAIGNQFINLLPLLWMKAGALGECPIAANNDIKPFYVLSENHMAILVRDTAYCDFKEALQNSHNIDTVYIVTDSDNDYRSMVTDLGVDNIYQLYRDYLDNFRLNITR